MDEYIELIIVHGASYICRMPLIRKKLSELNRPDIKTAQNIPRIPVTVILENVRSGHNIGSVFRTGDALNVERIILTGISVKPPHKEILKTALDSTLSVPWEYQQSVLSVVEELKTKGYQVAAVEQVHQSIPLQSLGFENRLPLALIFGNEIEGVSEEALALCDFGIEIPQEGIKHSLNISVCAGIVLWHCYESLVLNKLR